MSVPVPGSAADPMWRRIAECVYVVGTVGANILSSWIEDAWRASRKRK